MNSDEAREKARKVLLGIIILGVGPFFLATIFVGIILTNTLPLSIFSEANVLQARIFVVLVAVVFWGMVVFNEYRKGTK